MQGRNPAPPPDHGVVCGTARAAVGKIAHAIIRSVAALTVTRPSCARRDLVGVALRCDLPIPTSLGCCRTTIGGYPLPSLAILRPGRDYSIRLMATRRVGLSA